MNTFDLIEKYLFTQKGHLKGLSLGGYELIKCSVIRITYSYFFESSSFRSYNYFEVELLDYITFVFNNK